MQYVINLEANGPFTDDDAVEFASWVQSLVNEGEDECSEDCGECRFRPLEEDGFGYELPYEDEYDYYESIDDDSAEAIAEPNDGQSVDDIITDFISKFKLPSMPYVTKCIVHDPWVITFWSDGTVKRTKCQDGDRFSPFVGAFINCCKKVDKRTRYDRYEPIALILDAIDPTAKDLDMLHEVFRELSDVITTDGYRNPEEGEPPKATEQVNPFEIV